MSEQDNILEVRTAHRWTGLGAVRYSLRVARRHSTDGGAGTMLGSLVGVLLFYTIQNVIKQIGTLTSYTQQLVTGIFLIVVVAAQTYLTRQRTY